MEILKHQSQLLWIWRTIRWQDEKSCLRSLLEPGVQHRSHPEILGARELRLLLHYYMEADLPVGSKCVQLVQLLSLDPAVSGHIPMA